MVRQLKTDGVYTLKFGKLRIQLYSPNLTLRIGPQSEFHIGADTVVRLVVDHRNGFYVGAGFNVFGFGIGCDYFVPNEETAENIRTLRT